jgi:peptidoglycan/LPS O-acetylase OafA/YrhL
MQVTHSLGNRISTAFRTALHDLWNPPSSNVAGLDLLRTLAILLVVSGHYYGEFAQARQQTLAIGKFPFFYFAWTGVDLFFVLSGYLIGRQLWRELVTRNSIAVGTFLLRRGLRIWPFYFAFLALVFVTSSKPIAAFLPDIFFLSNYFPNAISGGWSLSTEEQFYIVMPLLLLTFGAVIRVRHQYATILFLLILLPVVRWLTLAAHPGNLPPEEFQRLVQLPFHTHADGLLAGVMLSWAAVISPSFISSRPLSRNIVLPAALMLAGLVVREISPKIFGFSGLAMIFGGMTLFALRDRTAFARLSKHRVFYLTSRLSYGMYLNHFLVLPLIVPLIVAATWSRNPYLGFVIGYPLVVVASIAVATTTFLMVESPFLQLRDRWLSRTRTGLEKLEKPLH